MLIRAETEVLAQRWSPNLNVFVHWDTRETDAKVNLVFNQSLSASVLSETIIFDEYLTVSQSE